MFVSHFTFCLQTNTIMSIQSNLNDETIVIKIVQSVWD